MCTGDRTGETVSVLNVYLVVVVVVVGWGCYTGDDQLEWVGDYWGQIELEIISLGVFWEYHCAADDIFGVFLYIWLLAVDSH